MLAKIKELQGECKYNEDGTPVIQAHGRFANFVEIDEENVYQSSYYDEEED